MADEPDESGKPKPHESKPYRPEGTGPDAPTGITPNPRVPSPGASVPAAGQPGSPYAPPPPKRTSAQIRADIENQRQQLGRNVDHLRDRVTEITDWRSQIKKHQKKIVIGAVATGFVVGGLMALRRR